MTDEIARKEAMTRDILTSEQAAAYLQINVRSLYRLVKGDKIPFKKVLNKFLFEKGRLREWIGKKSEK